MTYALMYLVIVLLTLLGNVLHVIGMLLASPGQVIRVVGLLLIEMSVTVAVRINTGRPWLSRNPGKGGVSRWRRMR